MYVHVTLIGILVTMSFPILLMNTNILTEHTHLMINFYIYMYVLLESYTLVHCRKVPTTLTFNIIIARQWRAYTKGTYIPYTL